MSELKAGELLDEQPILVGGELSLETGRDDFVELPMHEEFAERVQEKSSRRMTIWSLVGPYGIGRTWTLAWLGRQAQEGNVDGDVDYEAALVPGLGGGGDFREFIQHIFSSTKRLRSRVKEEKDVGQQMMQGVQTGGDAYPKIMSQAINRDEIWAVFEGDRSRFPSLSNIAEKPKWTRRKTQIGFLIAWLEELAESGIDNFLILVDEFEVLIDLLSRKNLVEFTDSLRRLFDRIESAEDIPNIQIILSGSEEVRGLLDPRATDKETKGWARALEDRMSPAFYMSGISEDQAKKIVRTVLERKRKEDVGNPYAPYTEDAIEYAHQVSQKRPRYFSQLLNEMYDIGKNSTEIGIETAKIAAKRLPYDEVTGED